MLEFWGDLLPQVTDVLGLVLPSLSMGPDQLVILVSLDRPVLQPLGDDLDPHMLGHLIALLFIQLQPQLANTPTPVHPL